MIISKKSIQHQYRNKKAKYNKLLKQATISLDKTASIQLSDKQRLLEEYRKLGIKPPSNKIYKR